MQFKELPISVISRERAPLMGLAILWVVIFHYGLSMPFVLISYLGFTGVDIFMFLSAYGLVRSLDNDPSPISFYKRRVLRIFPTYFFIGILAMIVLYNDGIMGYVYRFTCIGFWTNGLYYDWFIPAIVTLYLLFPLIYCFTKQANNKDAIIVVVLILIFIAFYHAVDVSKIDNPHFLLVYRLPIFILGACPFFYNSKIKEWVRISIIGAFCFFITIGIFFFYNKIRFLYLSTTFLTPGIILIFSCLLSKCRFMHDFFGYVGRCSLEIYMLFMLIYYYMKEFTLPLRDEYYNLTSIVLLVITVLGGVFLNIIINSVKSVIKLSI